VKNFSPLYPTYLIAEPFNSEPIDVELLDVDKPSFKNLIQKLQFAKYTKPEPINGPECINFIIKVI
jgi:hypothetical protein